MSLVVELVVSVLKMLIELFVEKANVPSTIEDSNPSPDLADRLRRRVRAHEDDLRARRDSGTSPRDNPGSEGVGC